MSPQPWPHFLGEESERQPASRAGAEPRGARKGASAPRALVVDDAADVTTLFAVLLRREGYEVVEAHSGAEALEAARRASFDLVVSDIGMPGMNGYQLAAALRALPGYEGVPMLAVTGFSRYDDPGRSLSAGFDDHLTKPVNPSVLASAVRRLHGGV